MAIFQEKDAFLILMAGKSALYKRLKIEVKIIESTFYKYSLGKQEMQNPNYWDQYTAILFNYSSG